MQSPRNDTELFKGTIIFPGLIHPDMFCVTAPVPFVIAAANRNVGSFHHASGPESSAGEVVR